jgi:hypothetical protein
MIEFLLKNFLDGSKKPVIEHQFIDVDSNIRVYYKPDEYGPGHGFDFWAMEHVGGYCAPGTEEHGWYPEHTFVMCMFTGSGAFDGIRHMYMGDPQTDDYGYHYYPSIEAHIATLRVIGDLEKKYCREKQEQP